MLQHRFPSGQTFKLHPNRKAKVLERDRTISTVVKGTRCEIAVADAVIVALRSLWLLQCAMQLFLRKIILKFHKLYKMTL
jgi:hypothetical protein